MDYDRYSVRHAKVMVVFLIFKGFIHNYNDYQIKKFIDKLKVISNNTVEFFQKLIEIVRKTIYSSNFRHSELALLKRCIITLLVGWLVGWLVGQNFVKIDKNHWSTCIFVSLAWFSIAFRTYVKILEILNFSNGCHFEFYSLI